jgi:hypothetical protein
MLKQSWHGEPLRDEGGLPSAIFTNTARFPLDAQRYFC